MAGYVKKIKIKEVGKKLNIRMTMFDDTEAELTTTGKMTFEQIVNGLVVNLKKAKK